MISSVTEVTEEHLVLILGLEAGHALLTVSALPVVAGHVAQQLQTEADTGGVRGLITLGAVKQQLWHSNLILMNVSVAVFTSGQGANLVNPPCLHLGLGHSLDGFLLLVPGGVLVSPRLGIRFSAAGV